MSIYSEPNSFFQLNNPVNFNCVESFDLCFEVKDINDLNNWGLTTNDNPSLDDTCEVPVTLYGYRLVTDCNLAAPLFSSNGYPTDITQFESSQLTNNIFPTPNEWALKPVSTEINTFISNLECNQCFYIQILKTITGCNDDFPEFGTPRTYTTTIEGCIGCFRKSCEDCYTSKLEYSNNENAFGFGYVDILGAFIKSNVIRLPFYLKEPQFPTQKNVFTLSNGSKKTLSARVEKEWIVETDLMPKEWHERLVIALAHDNINVVNTNANINSSVIMEGNYEIDWLGFLNYPLAKATFKLKQIPYNNINSNCK